MALKGIFAKTRFSNISILVIVVTIIFFTNSCSLFTYKLVSKTTHPLYFEFQIFSSNNNALLVGAEVINSYNKYCKMYNVDNNYISNENGVVLITLPPIRYGGAEEKPHIKFAIQKTNYAQKEVIFPRDFKGGYSKQSHKIKIFLAAEE